MSLHNPFRQLIRKPSADEIRQYGGTPVRTIVKPTGYPPDGNPRADQYSAKDDKTQQRIAVASIVLAVCAILGMGFTYFQLRLTQSAIDSGNQSTGQVLRQMRDQNRSSLISALSMRKAADASKIQADASKEIAAASNRQARISESVQRSAERVEAANIEIEKLFCNPYPGPLSIDSEVYYSMINSGRSTAYKVQMATYFGSYKSKVDPSVGDSHNDIVLGSGRSRDTGHIKVGDSVYEPYMKGINNKDPRAPDALHIWGWVSYWDQFGKRHLMVHDAAYVPNSTCQFSPLRIVTIP